MFLRTLLMAASDRKTGPCEDSEVWLQPCPQVSALSCVMIS